MTHAINNLSIEPTNAYYAEATAGMLHIGTLITNDSPALVEAADYLNASAKRISGPTVIDAIMNAASTPIAKKYLATSDGTTVTVTMMEVGAGGGVSPLTVLNAENISSKASDAAVVRWIAPFKFKINNLRSVLNAALATGNATVTLAIAGAAVTDGVLTATQASSYAGDIDIATPTAANTGAAGALITATVGGASTATATMNLQLELEETA